MGMFDKIKKVADATQLVQQASTIVGNLRNSFQSGNDSAENENSTDSENSENNLSTTDTIIEGSSLQVVKIESLEQMEQYLTSLQAGATQSAAATLAAQLQVINYISSPQLIDSSFDLFFQNIKKSINCVDNEQRKNDISEKSVLMIQNYIFFMNAKLTYTVQENKKEGQKLMKIAGGQLTNSISACVQLAKTGK